MTAAHSMRLTDDLWARLNACLVMHSIIWKRGLREILVHLKVSTAYEQVDLDPLFAFEMLQGCIDLVQVAMTASLDGNLRLHRAMSEHIIQKGIALVMLRL